MNVFKEAAELVSDEKQVEPSRAVALTHATLYIQISMQYASWTKLVSLVNQLLNLQSLELAFHHTLENTRGAEI